MSECCNISIETVSDVCVQLPCADICAEFLPTACVSVTVLDGSASITLDQFKVLMAQYNAFLAAQTRYKSEADAAADGITSGQEFLWASDTDVGIGGDKHIMT